MLPMLRLWAYGTGVSQSTEARGSGGSGSSSTVMGEVSEDPSSHCRRLLKE